MPDPRATTLPPAHSGIADGLDDRPGVRAAARHRALAAPRAGIMRSPLADAPEALDALSADLTPLLGQLRSTVGRYVRDRRAAGLAVERVVPEVRGLVREASAREGWSDPADMLMTRVVGWTIGAYYDEPELAHVPRSH